MTEPIIPLRPRGDGQPSLARFDLVAAELLAGGRVRSLQAARVEAILMDLRVQREQMSTLLADLRSRESTGDPHVDAVNANLIYAINQGIVQVDLFIARAGVLANDTAQSGQAPTDV